MSSNKLQMAVLIFIGGTVLCCIASKGWMIEGETNIINALASFNTIKVDIAGGWALAKGLLTFFSAVITALAWDYPFLSSPWATFIKIPLWIVSVGVIWAIVETFSSAVQGIVGSIRSIIGV